MKDKDLRKSPSLLLNVGELLLGLCLPPISPKYPNLNFKSMNLRRKKSSILSTIREERGAKRRPGEEKRGAKAYI